MKNILILIVMLFPLSAHAHPHVWVDVSVKANFNSKKQITSIYETWEFDDIFSSSVIADHDKNKDGKFDVAEIKSVRDNAFINLKNYGFYTHLFINDKKQKITEFKDFNAEIKNDKVVYEFTIPFPKPLNPFKDNVNLGIYDGEYYVELTYKNVPFTVEGIESSICPHAIFEDKKHPTYMGMVNPKTIKVCRK